MKLWKVVQRNGDRLWSAISSTGLFVEYEVGKPTNGISEEEYAVAPSSYYYDAFVDGVFVFSDLAKAREFRDQWPRREVWECTGDIAENRANGVSIAKNVVLTKQVKEKK